MVGWYIYQVVPGDVGQVAQIVATDEAAPDVIAHLMHDAFEQGLVAVAGRARRKLAGHLTRAGAFLHGRGDIAVGHSTDAEIRAALSEGDVFLTRLEGEGALNFVVSPGQVRTLLARGPAQPPTTADRGEPVATR